MTKKEVKHYIIIFKKIASEDRTCSSMVQVHTQWQPWVFVVFIH